MSTNEFWKFSHDTPSVANCISRCFPVEPQLLKPPKCPYLWLHRERKFEKTTTRGLKSKGKINDLISLIARFKSILQLPDSWFYHTCGCQYWYQHTNVDASQSTAREDRVYLLKLANKQLLWDCTEGEGRRKKKKKVFPSTSSAIKGAALVSASRVTLRPAILYSMSCHGLLFVTLPANHFNIQSSTIS